MCNGATASEPKSENSQIASALWHHLASVRMGFCDTRLIRWTGYICMAAILLLGADRARADNEIIMLSKSGTDLGRIETTGEIDDLRFTVDLQRDVPAGFYVWATLDSAHRLQRTNEGYWLKWNGDLQTLIDNRFPVVDGKVQFKIIDETLNEHAHGVDISIGYRVGGVLKYGKFAIAPATAGQ